MNLIDTIKGSLGSDVIDRCSALLGANPDQTRSAVTASVPALLAGLVSTSSTTEGARRLSSSLNDVDDRWASGFGQALGGDPSTLTQRGSGMLDSILGGNMFDGINRCISKFTGLGTGAVSSLLGMLAPLILGTLKRESNANGGLDASGLASMLAGQKQSIMSALPSGLSTSLCGIPGLSALGDAARGAVDTTRGYVDSAASAGRAAAARAGTATRQAATAGASSALKWIVPLVIVLLVGWLIYAAMNRPSTAPVTAPAIATGPLARPEVALPSDPLGTVTIGLNGLVTDATTALTSVKDAASADAAAAKLRDLTARLDAMRGTVGQLTVDQRSNIASLISSLKSKLQPAIDKALAIPGVRDKLKPATDALTDRMTTLTAAR